MRPTSFSAGLTTLLRHQTWRVVGAAFTWAACSSSLPKELASASTMTTAAPIDAPSSLADAPTLDATLSDAQVAAIASELQEAEIDAATFALSETDDPKVRKIAEHIVKAASSSNSHLGAVVQNQNIAPAESSLGATLEGASQERSDSLRTQSRGELDRTFMAAQLKSDEGALGVFDRALIPNTQNAMLKDALVSIHARLIDDTQMLKRALSRPPDLPTADSATPTL